GDGALGALGGAHDGVLDLLGVEQRGAAVALDDGELAEPRVLDHPLLGLLAQRLPLGAVEDVGLADLVEPVEHQVLLDDVLDVLDVGIEVDEAARDLVTYAVDQRIESFVGHLGLLAGGSHGLDDGVLDPTLVEVDDFSGALDDSGGEHLRPSCDVGIPSHQGPLLDGSSPREAAGAGRGYDVSSRNAHRENYNM